MPRRLAVLVASLMPLAAAAEDMDHRFTFDEDTPVPAVVMALQDCGAFADVISNIRLYPETNEIGEIFVDREVEGQTDPNVCRTEGRWRLEGKPPKPRLVFWRETADCEGNTGWTLIVGKR